MASNSCTAKSCAHCTRSARLRARPVAPTRDTPSEGWRSPSPRAPQDREKIRTREAIENLVSDSDTPLEGWRRPSPSAPPQARAVFVLLERALAPRTKDFILLKFGFLTLGSAAGAGGLHLPGAGAGAPAAAVGGARAGGSRPPPPPRSFRSAWRSPLLSSLSSAPGLPRSPPLSPLFSVCWGGQLPPGQPFPGDGSLARTHTHARARARTHARTHARKRFSILGPREWIDWAGPGRLQVGRAGLGIL